MPELQDFHTKVINILVYGRKNIYEVIKKNIIITLIIKEAADTLCDLIVKLIVITFDL